MMNFFTRYLSWLLLTWLLIATPSCKEKPVSVEVAEEQAAVLPIARPVFSADSAYAYIAKQVEFGPRVPGTKAHRQCADWLVATFRRFGWETKIQETKVKVYSGEEVPCLNIIASINPDAERRLLLCAHWDTRPFADQYAPDPYAKIDGADDGGSGVGVLLEIARQLQARQPEIGIDIVLFDVEDWGEHQHERGFQEDTYCLGSQYWSRNPHKPGYKAEKGILLDMVGGKGATFTLEGTSMRYAGAFMQQVWEIARQLGHGQYFLQKQTPGIVDDHLYVNQIAGIPTIDIIHHSPHTPTGFPPHWHTPFDNMKVIDKAVLQAVGETVLAVVYGF